MFKMPSWLMKSTVKRTVKQQAKNSNAKVTKARPAPTMWVGWPMDEEFNPNALDAAHNLMMQKLGRKPVSS